MTRPLRKNGRPASSTNKKAIWARNKYAKDAEYRANEIAKNTARRCEGGEIINEWKLARGCLFCPAPHPVCVLQAHHIDPTEKEATLSSMRTYNPARIRTELAKCICVCANCHIKLHEGLLELPHDSDRHCYAQ